MKIKKGDNVIVIAGGSKGKKGKVLKAMPAVNKVIVDGIHMMKKSVRGGKKGEKGQLVSVAMPIHVSNVSKSE